MREFALTMNPRQLFEFKKDRQAQVGVLQKLSVGDIKMDADLKIKDPQNPGQNISGDVVGVLTHFSWDTTPTGAIYIGAQISVKNKTALAAKLLSTLTSTEVVFDFTCYSYDLKEKKYFKCSWSDAELKGVLEKNGEDLNVAVDGEPCLEPQSPQTFMLTLGIKASPEAQTINLATASAVNLVKGWGSETNQ